MPCKACHPQKPVGIAKVLYFDTENSPSRGYFYGRKYETNIQWVDEEWKFLMYSYAWNDGKVYVVQSWNERELVNRMWELLDECDVLIAHNAVFDLGHFYAKCLKYGLRVPRPFKVVCTLKMYRKLCKGGFESNSLKDLAVALGLPLKKELPKGFWRDYMTKDKKVVKKGIAYARGDIVTLREVYKVIRDFFPPIKIKCYK